MKLALILMCLAQIVLSLAAQKPAGWWALLLSLLAILWLTAGVPHWL